MKSRKISITLPADLDEYSNARKSAFGDSLSAYIQYLMQCERDGSLQSAPTHEEDVLKVCAAKWGKRIKKDSQPFVAVAGGTGVAAVIHYQHGEPLWKMISAWAAGWERHGLNHMWLILPDTASDSDLVNFNVLNRNKVLPSISVGRLGDLEDFLA